MVHVTTNKAKKEVTMSVYKEKNNTWKATFWYTDWTGRKKQTTKRGFATKKEARKFEAEYKRTANADMGMLLCSFVEVYYKDKEGELKERTMKNKKYMISTHILPYFGERKMNEITPADLISWQNEIRGRNYSQSYLRMLQNQVTAIFEHASKIYGLRNNPCKKVKKMGKSDNRSLTFWTAEEYEEFISTFEEGSRARTMFDILFWTGCREGEMLALSKNDIDMEDDQIHITKTFYRKDGKDIITEPKTENSVRTVDIPKFLTEEISNYYSSLYEYPEDARLFPVTHEAVQHLLKNHVRMAGIKKIRVHDLRHSHAAYLIHHGVAPLLIKERLGHKDIKITLNTYGHLYPNEQKKLAGLLDDLNRGEKKDG